MARARRRTTRRAVPVALTCALAVMTSLLIAVPADAAGIYLHRGSRGANVKTLETRLHTLGPVVPGRRGPALPLLHVAGSQEVPALTQAPGHR